MENNKDYLNELNSDLKRYKRKFTSMKKSFEGKADKKSDKIMSSLQDVIDEAGESYEKLSTASSQEWESLKKVAGRSFEKLKDTFEDGSEEFMDQINEITRPMEEYSEEALEWGADYIKKNPFKSVIFASLIGMITGRVFR